MKKLIGGQMTKYIIRNSIAVGAFLTFIVLLYTFYSGSTIYEKIQGEWVCVENSDILVFINREYIHNKESGSFRIHGNKIVLIDSGNEYFIAAKNDYIVFDGAYYLKR